MTDISFWCDDGPKLETSVISLCLFLQFTTWTFISRRQSVVCHRLRSENDKFWEQACVYQSLGLSDIICYNTHTHTHTQVKHCTHVSPVSVTFALVSRNPPWLFLKLHFIFSLIVKMLSTVDCKLEGLYLRGLLKRALVERDPWDVHLLAWR